LLCVNGEEYFFLTNGRNEWLFTSFTPALYSEIERKRERDGIGEKGEEEQERY
jgi:hypothetical protein